MGSRTGGRPLIALGRCEPFEVTLVVEATQATVASPSLHLAPPLAQNLHQTSDPTPATSSPQAPGQGGEGEMSLGEASRGGDRPSIWETILL